MATKATATRVTDNPHYVAKLHVQGSVEVTVGLSAKDRDVLLYELIRTLPSDHDLRQHMRI